MSLALYEVFPVFRSFFAWGACGFFDTTCVRCALCSVPGLWDFRREMGAGDAVEATGDVTPNPSPALHVLYSSFVEGCHSVRSVL